MRKNPELFPFAPFDVKNPHWENTPAKEGEFRGGMYMDWSENSISLTPTAPECKAALEKAIWQSSKSIGIVPLDKRQPWFWALGEIAEEWWDILLDAPI